MGRIRTIKPEFFTHEGLFEIEKQSGLPVRVAFAGLFTVADKEGRFEWKPKIIKLKVMPWDEVSFEAVLSALEASGFVRRYMVGDKVFGFIPSWHTHQRVKADEAQSRLPDPKDGTEIALPEPKKTPIGTDSAPTGTDSDRTRVVEGKGRELERELEKERERRGNALCALAPGKKVRKRREVGGEEMRRFIATWCEGYKTRHGVPFDAGDPKFLGQAKTAVLRKGPDKACLLAQIFFQVPNTFYAKRGHDIGIFLTDIPALELCLATGREKPGEKSWEEYYAEQYGEAAT